MDTLYMNLIQALTEETMLKAKMSFFFFFTILSFYTVIIVCV